MQKGKSKDKKPQHREGVVFSAKDFLCGKSYLTVEGNHRVTLEGSRGVVEYSTERISVSVEDFILSFSGRSLMLKCISPTALIIEGYIINIGFSD